MTFDKMIILSIIYVFKFQNIMLPLFGTLHD